MGAAKQHELSRQFSEYIGNANLKNPGAPTEIEQFYIQQAFVEAYCIYTDKHEPLDWVPQEAKEPSRGRSICHSPNQATIIGEHSLFTKIHAVPEPIKSYVELYCHAKSCGYHKAVAELAKKYSLDSNVLFGEAKYIPQSEARHSYKSATPLLRSQQYPVDSFPAPERLEIEGVIYKSRGLINFSAALNGLIFQVIPYFADDGTELHIPLHIRKQPMHDRNTSAIVDEYELAYGPGKASLPLYNLNLIDKLNAPSKPEAATVFLCEDLKIAVNLSAIIADSQRLGDGQFKATDLYVATGWYGGTRRMGCVDFGPLWNKKIIFIPAISRFSYTESVKTIEKYCLQAKVKEFKIYRPAVLKTPPCNENYSPVDEISDPWERYLAKSNVSLRDCESFVVKKMLENAVTFEDYIRWGEKVGLFTPSNEDVALKQGVSYTHTHTVSQLRTNFSLEPGAGLKLDCFGTFENMTILYGRRYSSKSMLALAVAVGRACGQNFLDFEALLPSKVLYIDGETSGQAFRERFERMVSAFRCNPDLVEANFHMALLRGDHQLSAIDLENENQQNEIVKLIRQYKSELIVFDNLQSLLGGFRSNNATGAWKAFYEWLLHLEKTYQTGFLLVHHDNDDGGPAGTKQVTNLCATEIYIMGKEGLKEELKKNDRPHDLEMYKPYLEKGGALFRAEIKKSKFYGSIETSPFGGFLSAPQAIGAHFRGISGPPWQAIGSLIPAKHQELLSGNPEALAAEVKAKYPGRTDDEYKIIEHLTIYKTITNKEICSLLMVSKGRPCSRSTATKRIRPLKNSGVIDLLGAGPSSYYQLREVADAAEEAV